MFKRPIPRKGIHVPFEPRVYGPLDTRVQDIIDSLGKDVAFIPPKPCEPKPYVSPPFPSPKPQINLKHLESIEEKYFSRGKMPPLIEYTRALLKAGYSEDKIDKMYKKIKWLDEHDDEIQNEIETLWPGKKVKREGPHKVLKAVKKH
jgi:hypothetical protein